MTILNDIKNTIEEARAKYRPHEVKCLLIAEAPPEGLNRFFYYPDVKTADGLFLGVMEALYPSLKREYMAQKRQTTLKEKMLRQFQADGFYLMDLLDVPKGLYPGRCEDATDDLVNRVKGVAKLDTPIILIKANVYDIARGPLQCVGYRVVEQRIPFPGSGQQARFRQAFGDALASVGLLPA
jgi:hypothetical protein